MSVDIGARLIASRGSDKRRGEPSNDLAYTGRGDSESTARREKRYFVREAVVGTRSSRNDLGRIPDVLMTCEASKTKFRRDSVGNVKINESPWNTVE